MARRVAPGWPAGHLQLAPTVSPAGDSGAGALTRGASVRVHHCVPYCAVSPVHLRAPVPRHDPALRGVWHTPVRHLRLRPASQQLQEVEAIDIF